MPPEAEPLAAAPSSPSGIALAIAAARALLRSRPVRSPDDIHVARFARDLGASVVFRDTGAADGRIVREGGKALICIDQNARGAPRARWTAAHELGHLLRHRDYDALNRIHAGGKKTGRDYQVEREADAFSAEFLMPEWMFAPRCRTEQPTVDHLDEIGGEYGTSLTSTGRRYTEFSRAACALLECKNGKVARAKRSAAFRGVALERRVLEAQTAAARLSRGEAVTAGPERVTSGAWGSARLDAEMTEHAILVPESGTVLVWLLHGLTR